MEESESPRPSLDGLIFGCLFLKSSWGLRHGGFLLAQLLIPVTVSAATNGEIPDAVLWTGTGGILTAAAGLLTMLLRRTFSRDSTAIKGDKVEATQFTRLEAEIKYQSDRADSERARADVAFHERNEAIERAADAIGKIAALEQRIETLTRELHTLQQILNGIYGGRFPRKGNNDTGNT